MKNQTFNIKRFITFSRYNLSINIKKYISQLLIIAIGIFCILFIVPASSHSFHSDEWANTFIILGIITLLYAIACSFSYLHRKESRIEYLLKPASTTEKFLFEFLFRFVGALIIFPILFFLMGKLSYPILKVYRILIDWSSASLDPISCINPDYIFHFIFGGQVVGAIIIIGFILLIISILFAGSIVFKKAFLAKTTGFIIAIGALIGIYFYILTQKLRVTTPVIPVKIGKLPINQQYSIFIIIFGLLILCTLFYAFFKLKEKEV